MRAPIGQLRERPRRHGARLIATVRSSIPRRVQNARAGRLAPRRPRRVCLNRTLENDMESALRPREIQSRIRAGESLEEVARLAGAPVDRIERFAAPVLAERQHVARLALASSVRRLGELSGHRVLREVAFTQLRTHGVDPESVEWDAWRNEDKRWTVQARWVQDGNQRSALFQFDLVSRFSTAAESEARWLIAETPDDQEDSDSLALVRVVGGGDTQELARQNSESEPTTFLDEDQPAGEVLGDAGRFGGHTMEDQPFDQTAFGGPGVEQAEPVGPASAPFDGHEQLGGHEPDHAGADRPRFPRADNIADETRPREDWVPRSAATPQEIREEVEAEIDAYGVVPEGRSELDVLYDMLGGLAEDSINIYAGLSDPIVPSTPELDDRQRPAHEAQEASGDFPVPIAPEVPEIEDPPEPAWSGPRRAAVGDEPEPEPSRPLDPLSAAARRAQVDDDPD
ncbi:MAG: septation protein SepH, partial [Propionibacteriaceae bacterium]|nr:septation protein SepH [Propionibacteriaceae bacterium]